MDRQYMDYGSIISKDTYTIPKNLTLIDYNKKGLVYRLTHDGEGKSLSFMNKAFISFTYGNRKILDFGFVATTVNNRLDRENAPESEDYITEYKMLNGQYYWGSHYCARELTITLATDGITQKQLDDFKYWFQPGEIRLLILSLHPNRAILARVQGRPEISVLPFKRIERIFINDDWKEIEIIEYKGEAQINFVMDEPFWYAKYNVLGNLIEDNYGNYVLADSWIDSNGNVIDILDTDAWKVAIEDKIPTSGMINYQVIYSDVMELLPYNIYKYTLDEEKKIEAKNLRGLLIVGAPLANDNLDIEYPLSGAVVGILYKPIYTEDARITYISNAHIKLDYMFSSSDGTICKRNYTEGLEELKDLITVDYIPIKAGSTINYISNKLDGIVIIQKYIAINEYSYKLNKEITLSYFDTDFIAEEDMVIRINVNIPSDSWHKDDGTFLLSKFIKMSLIPFESALQGHKLDKDNNLYYFYSGNAVSYPKINFSIPIHFNEEGYIDSFSSENLLHLNLKPYNTLKLESEFSHELKITNPSIFDSYNMVIKKLKEEQEQDIPSFVQDLRNTITHPAVRNWIINCINIYYNNFDMESMIINNSVKQKLLQYMPYLFVSFNLVNILKQENEPTILKESFQLLYKTEIKRMDSLAIRMPIKNKQLPIILGDNFKISITTYSDLLHIINSGLYYQWQYSNPNEPSKWYLIFDDYDSTELTGKWLGATTQTLQGFNIDENDENMKLRCIVSNNSTHIISNLITIQFDSGTINISCDSNSNITMNQNSTKTLTWLITGHYLEGNNILTSDFKPAIYYKINGSNNWIKYNSNNENNNYQLQIINGQLNTNELTKISFSFKASENLGHIQGIQFKLVVYPLNALAVISNNDLNDDIMYPPYTITTFNRLRINNAQVTLIGSYRGLDSNIDISNADQGCIPNTFLTLTINNLENVSSKQNNTYIEIGNLNLWLSMLKNEDKEAYGNINKSLSANSITFSWTLNTNWNNQNTLIRISTTNYGETQYIPIHNVYRFEDDQMNKEIDNYEIKSLNFNENLITNLYQEENDLQLKINHSNSIPVGTETCTTTYQWYYRASQSNIKILLGEEQIFNGLVGSSTYKINKENLQLSDAGYYSCKLTLKFEYASNPNNYKSYDTLSEEVEIKIIKRISLGNIICSLPLGRGTYYSLLTPPEMDDMNNNKLSFPYHLTFSYTINNYQNNVEYYVQWYTNTGKLGSQIQVNASTVQYDITCNNAQYLWGLNNKQYYCIITDSYGTTYLPINTNKIQLSFKDERNRIQDIALENPNVLNQFIEWDWPVHHYYNIEDGLLGSKDEIKTITYNMNWNKDNNSLVLKGTPMTNTLPSNENIADRNSAAGGIDGYTKNCNLNHVERLSSQYTGYNALYYPVIQFFGTTYKKIQFKGKFIINNTADNCVYQYKILKNNLLLKTETKLEKNSIIEIDQNLDINDNIKIYLKIYYNSIWPKNIGTIIYDSDAPHLVSGFNMYNMYKPYIYNKNNLPISLATLKVEYMQGQLRPVTRTLKGLMRRSALLNTSENSLLLNITQSCPISLNCNTGEYFMQIAYNTIDWPNGILPKLNDSNQDPKLICYLSSLRKGLSHIITESIGNAILYNDLVFMLQNHFNPITNQVEIWNDTDKTLCHKLSYDGDIPLLNFNILYKNLYL